MVKLFGFCGNVHMQGFVLAALSSGRITAFIETGTHEGGTAQWVAQNSNVPVMTCEKNPVKYRRLVNKLLRVDVFEGDSPLFLEEVAPLAGECPLFYLDAHSVSENPLPRELEVIERCYKKAVWIAHDFRVPFESLFTYHDDRYGPEFVNRWESVLPIIDESAICGVYFPDYKPARRARTGYVIVFRSVEPFAVDVGCLRRHEWMKGHKRTNG